MSTTSTPKLVVIVGATGNQGGSVARRFLRLGTDRFRVRGLTRDTTSSASQALADLGAEMCTADLFDPVSLAQAFRGASFIFSVTNYWEPFAAPHNLTNTNRPGLGIREHAGEREATAGRNIADAAAATVHTLDENGFIASTLSHAGRCSAGRFQELYHFDAKAEVFPFYVRERHPELAAKMSCIQTGFFMTSHQILPDSWLAKVADGTFEMRFCTDPEKPIPHLDPVADMGNFVYAVYQSKLGAGKEYMAEGTTCTWPQWIAAWSKAVGLPATYRQVSREDMIKACGGDGEFGCEIADMYSYSSDPGYDGGKLLLRAEDLRKVSVSPGPFEYTGDADFSWAGVECPMTSLEEWLDRQDWSGVRSKDISPL